MRRTAQRECANSQHIKMMTMGQLVLGVRARARECIEVRVGCTKRTEVAGGVGTPVRPSYNTSP